MERDIEHHRDTTQVRAYGRSNTDNAGLNKTAAYPHNKRAVLAFADDNSS